MTNMVKISKKPVINLPGKLINYFQKLRSASHKYVKYIILGNPRTGSTFLRGLLNSHNNIIAFSELFRFNDSIGWDYPVYDNKAKSDLLLINDDPIKFLKKKVFRNFPPHILAVGFKIFYFHAQNGNWKSVWTYLKDSKDIKVIHIKRKNVLKTYISHTRALQTKKWINTSGKIEDQPPIFLEYVKCLHYFKQIKEYERKYDDFFKGHDKIELIYEDMVNCYTRELRRITDFVGVTYIDVKPVTFQQARKPLFETISNYQELKKKFKSTPWEDYFED